MRLLMLGPLPPPLGGTTLSFEQLVRELRESEGVEVELLDTSRGTRHGRSADLRTALSTFARLPARLGTADVVTFHASTPGTVLFAPVLAALCRLWSRPLVIREFGGSFDADFDALPAPVRWLVGRALRSAVLLLQTRSLVTYFERALPGARCRWFPNSRPWTAPDAEPPTGGAHRFVFLGHVKREKGVRELIEAAHGLGSRDLHIDVYGPLLDGTRVEDFTGNPRIRYRGTIPSERVSRVLRGYDVLVLPTYHPGEGYPGAILEAWAEDLPVITTRWRSLPEIVEHGVNGILVEPRDAEGLAGAILRLHADPDLMRVLRRGARASAEEFASRRWTRAFLEICRGATRGPSASESQLTRRSAGV